MSHVLSRRYGRAVFMQHVATPPLTPLQIDVLKMLMDLRWHTQHSVQDIVPAADVVFQRLAKRNMIEREGTPVRVRLTRLGDVSVRNYYP